jgi:diguanylate cyclase (GGDEF)-like protein
MSSNSLNQSLADAPRSNKRRGVFLAAIGYALGIAVLWLCRQLDYTGVTNRQMLWCTLFFVANTVLMLLILQMHWDEKLKFDPHFIYTPVFTSILWLTYYLYISGDARGLLFSVIFLPFMFMVSLVGLRDGLVISSLFVIAYLTMLLRLAQNEILDTQAEGVRVTVFFLVMIFICFVMERTKRQRQRHIATLKEVAALQEMGKTLVSTLVVDKLVDQILSIIKDKFGYVNCSLWTVDFETRELVMRAQKGFILKNNSQPIRLPLSGMGLTVWVVNHGEMVNVGDVSKDHRYTTGGIESEQLIASEMVVPLKRQGQVFAVLDVQNESINGFDRNDERVLTAVADYASIALANARWVDEIHDRANRDGLTGLYNHRFLLEQLEIELHRADRLAIPCSFIMADIDNFKAANDVHGHQNGDEILKQISTMLVSSLRSIDIVARYGGEEFSVILLNVTKPDALVVAEKLRRKIEDSVFLDFNQSPFLHITASLGVATFPVDAHSPAELIRAADQRLYQAKRNGRNCVCPPPT